MKTKLLLAVGITLTLSAFGQTNPRMAVGVEPMAHTPTFRVTVVSRNVDAVNYRHRSGATKLDFAGTDLMNSANGLSAVRLVNGC